MKIFKSLLVALITVTLVCPPSCTSLASAYTGPDSWSDDSSNENISEYREPYRSVRESIRFEEEEKVEAPEPVDPPDPPKPPAEQEKVLEEEDALERNATLNQEDARVNAAGDTIKLNNGVNLTEQDDGTYKDDDGNKWIKDQDEDGNEIYRQLGFPAGHEIELKDGTKLKSSAYFEFNEDGTIDDGIEFKDEGGSRWKTYEDSFRRIDYPANTEIKLDGGKVLRNSEPFVANDDGSIPDGVKFKDQEGSTWISKDGKFSQTSYQAGQYEIEVTKTDGTKIKLTNTGEFEFKEDGSLPDQVWFKDEQGNRWVTYKDSINQIDYAANTEIKLSDGTVLTNTKAFAANIDGTIPDGVEFKDQAGSRWSTHGGSYVRIDYPENTSITLADGTIIKNTKVFVANPDGSIPDGVEFKDDKGNTWVTFEGGKFKQTGAAANTLSITLNNGLTLTNATPYELNADGTLPAGIIFKDGTYGLMWISGANGSFTVFDPAKDSLSSLQIVQKLKGLSAKDAAALLEKCDPAAAQFILMGKDINTLQRSSTQLFTDQQVTDIFKEMDGDTLAAILNTCIKVVDPYERVMNRTNIPDVMFNEMTDPRLTGILAGLDTSKMVELLSSDKLGVDMASLIGLKASAAVWNALSSDRAAEIANALIAIGVSGGGQGYSGIDGVDKGTNGGPDVTGYSTGGPAKYDLNQVEVDRIKAFSSILSQMDPAKAAALLNSDKLSLSNAAKLMLRVPAQVMNYDADGNPVSSTNGRVGILAELAKVNPERAQSIQEVVAYLGTVKTLYYGVHSAEADYYAALTSQDRPLTTSEKSNYKILFGKDFTSLSQVPGFSGSDISATIAGLSTEDAAKMLKFVGDTKATAVLASGSLTVDQASEILGKLGTEKTATILAAMDKTNAIKADSLRVKMGIDPDLSAMAADDQAEYLAGLDPAKAAVKLARLGLDKQIDDFFMNNLGRQATAEEKAQWLNAAGSGSAGTLNQQMLQSIYKTAEYKAFATQKIEEFYNVILGRQSDAKGLANWVFAATYTGMSLEEIKNQFLASPEFQAKTDKKTLAEYNTLLGISSNAGAQISEILSSDNITAEQASKILGAMIDLATTVTNLPVYEDGSGGGTVTTIDTNLVVETLKGLAADKAAGILAGLGTEKAVLALNNGKMSVEDAAAILKQADAQTLTSILMLLDTSNKAKSDQIRAAIGAVPGKMTPNASAHYLSTLDPAVAAAELAKLTDDEAAAILADPQMHPAVAANILKGMEAAKVAKYISSDKMSAEAAVAILTKLKISDGFGFTEIMAQLGFDVANKEKAGQITAEMDKVPSSTMVSSTEQTRLKAIYGYAPTFSTQEVVAGANGAPDSVSWKYYDQYGQLIGSRIDANPGTVSGYDDYGTPSIGYGGYRATYYDINGQAIKSEAGGFQKLPTEQSNALTDVFQAKAVYTKSVQTYVNAGGGGGGVTNYYDENFNLLGSQGYATTYRGVNGFVTEKYGFKDAKGIQITAGTPQAMSNGGTTLTNTATATRTITAGSEEEKSLMSVFGAAPATAREFYQSYMWDGTGGTSNGEGFNVAPQWVSKGLITTYYDKDGNLLGSKKTIQTSDWFGGVVSTDHWYDNNGAEIAANGYGTPPVAQTNYNCATYSLAGLVAGKSLEEINTALKPYTTNGLTSLLGLKTIANEYGLDMEAVKTQFPNLVKDTDAIVHFNEGHYVKLVSYDEASGKVTYNDNGALKTATEEEFGKNFSGYALIHKILASAADIISDTIAGTITGSSSTPEGTESLGAQGLLSPSQMRAMGSTPQWSSSNNGNGGAPVYGLIGTGGTTATAVGFSNGKPTFVNVSAQTVKSLDKIEFRPSIGIQLPSDPQIAAQLKAQAPGVGLKLVAEQGKEYLIDAKWEPPKAEAVKAVPVKQNAEETISPEKLAETELTVKLWASQDGADVKAAVSSSGTTYTHYIRDEGGNVVGKDVYTFTYDRNDNVTGGNVTHYGYSSGTFTKVGSADQGTQQENVRTPVPGVKGVYFTGEIGLIKQPAAAMADLKPEQSAPALEPKHAETDAQDNWFNKLVASTGNFIQNLFSKNGDKGAAAVNPSGDWTNSLNLPNGAALPDLAANNGGVDRVPADSGHSWAQDTYNGFGQWLSDTTKGWSEGGWTKDPLAYFLSGVSDAGERLQEFSSDTINHMQNNKSINVAEQDSNASTNEDTFVRDIVRSWFGVNLKADNGQKSVQMGEKMIELFSDRYSRQAVINTLHEIGYANLDRFDVTTLRSLVNNKLDPKDDTRPLAVVVFPSDDWNGSFALNNEIFRDLLSRGYKIDYYQVSTDVEAMDAIKKATDNGDNPASVIYIGGHGNQGTVEFGTPFMFGVSGFNLADESALKDLQPSLKNGGTVMFSSCSVGKGETQENNIVNLFARIFPQADRVIGPTDSTRMSNIIWGERNNIAGVTYYTNNGARTYDAMLYKADSEEKGPESGFWLLPPLT